MKKKILVTGGTGFIGSHTVVELLEANYEVVIIDDLSNSNENVIENIKKICGKKPDFEKFNLTENDKLKAFFKKHTNIDAIIHFAAYKAVGESVNFPLKYYKNNLFSLVNLLAFMEQGCAPALVFSSSCTVYGQPLSLPVTEQAPIQIANSPYGNTKQISEEIINETVAANAGKIKCVALRYFNPIGAHHSALIGELPLGIPNNLVPYITQSAAGIRGAVNVFGNNYNTPDGTAIRDYIHVVDLAKAHIVAVERMLNNQTKSDFEVFNIGTGKGSSVLEIINTFEKATQQKLNYTIAPRRAGDIEQVWADTTLANNELGWKAELNIYDMLLSAWNWEKTLMNI